MKHGYALHSSEEAWILAVESNEPLNAPRPVNPTPYTPEPPNPGLKKTQTHLLAGDYSKSPYKRQLI